MDLADFEQEVKESRSSSTKCSTCNLPDEARQQVEAGRHREPPISYITISQWLKREHDVELNHATIRNHFQAGHDS